MEPRPRLAGSAVRYARHVRAGGEKLHGRVTFARPCQALPVADRGAGSRRDGQGFCSAYTLNTSQPRALLRQLKSKGLIVNVHKFTSLEVFGVVDSASADISDFALVKENPLSIRNQSARFLAVKLDRHLPLYNDRHIVAGV